MVLVATPILLILIIDLVFSVCNTNKAFILLSPFFRQDSIRPALVEPYSFISLDIHKEIQECDLKADDKVLDVLIHRVSPPFHVDSSLEHIFDVALHNRYVSCSYQASNPRILSLLQ